MIWWEEQLGIKLPVLVSGLVGGIASLAYHQQISFVRALLLIAIGAATAVYLEPFLQSYFGFDQRLSTGVGFILGLVSMRVTNFLMAFVDSILKNPSSLISVIRNKNAGNN